MRYIVKDKELDWPEDKCFYIMAQNGLFKCRNHSFFTSCVCVHEGHFDGLLPQETFCHIKYPKMPREMMENIWAFFTATADKHQAEAIVLPCIDIDTGKVVPFTPKQESTGMHVEYKNVDDKPDNYMIIGSIHSHVDAGAFHSGTDTNDEREKDGLHITLGHVRGKFPDISAEVAIDGKRFKVRPEDVIEDFYSRSMLVPDGWMKQHKYVSWRHKWRKHKWRPEEEEVEQRGWWWD